MARVRLRLSAAAGGIACAIALTTLTSHVALAGDINFRSFSASAAIGPPAEAFAAKLQNVTRTALGAAGEVRFVKLPGIPAVPAQFAGDIVSAVAAGQAGGGFDAAYISGSELNRAWGFIYNSGVPFGPSFDEFIGFLYGRSIDNGQKTGLDLVQELLDLKGRNVVAIPIVGSPEQLSGYLATAWGPTRRTSTSSSNRVIRNFTASTPWCARTSTTSTSSRDELGSTHLLGSLRTVHDCER